MKTKNTILKVAALASLLAVSPSRPAQAGLSYDYTDSGRTPQGGTVFSVEHSMSGIPSSITSLELILRFNDSSSLAGNSSGIEGHLILGSGTDSPYAEFFPVATYISGQERIYDVTLSGPSGNSGVGFSGLNLNSPWGLVLWDNSGSGLQNGLNSWSLNIEAVPEPVQAALGIFAGLFGLATLARAFIGCIYRSDPGS